MKKTSRSIGFIFVLFACGHNNEVDTTANKIQTGSGPYNSSTTIEAQPLPDEHTACLKTYNSDKTAAESYCNMMEEARNPNILPPAYTSCMRYTNGSPRCAVYLNSGTYYNPWMY